MKVIAVSELFAIHAKDLRSRPELFGESLRYRIIAGGLVRAEEYLLALRARTDLARATQDAMAKVDVVMLPTASRRGGCSRCIPPALHPAELHLPVQRCGQPSAVRLQRLRRGGSAILSADRWQAVR